MGQWMAIPSLAAAARAIPRHGSWLLPRQHVTRGVPS